MAGQIANIWAFYVLVPDLAASAHRISLAYLFDHLLAVHISNVEPLPHQIATVITPELLCLDRRNGVISLYLVRPLTISRS